MNTILVCFKVVESRKDPDLSKENVAAGSATLPELSVIYSLTHLVTQAVDLKELVQVPDAGYDDLLTRVDETQHGLETYRYSFYSNIVIATLIL